MEEQAVARAALEVYIDTLEDQLQDAERAYVIQVDNIRSLTEEKEQAEIRANELEIENAQWRDSLHNATWLQNE